MKNLLERVYRDTVHYTADGSLASYIPELKNADKGALGICIADSASGVFAVGSSDVRFTMHRASLP